MTNLNALKKNLLSLVAILVAGQWLFGHSILNPVAGKWANKQYLVIELEDEESAYYSLNGSNPESFGFAYDGPVLLDVDGNVSLKVAIVDKDGKTSLFDVDYSVTNQFCEDEDVSLFINSCADGLIPYTVGDTISIPQKMEFAVGQPPEVFEQGTDISIDKKSVLARYVPLALSFEDVFWRFVIDVKPVLSGLYGRIDVPFEISDWENISFTDRKMIYKIDDQWWMQPKQPVKLDRSVSHMISWQSVDYSPENSIKYCVLPPKPKLITTTSKTGSVFVSFEGEEGYKFGIFDDSENTTALYDSFEIDTFQGDRYRGNLKVGLYYDSVYQGFSCIEFNINKRMPAIPKIVSSANGDFSRTSIALNLTSEENCKIFVYIQKQDLSSDYKKSEDFLNLSSKKIEQQDFSSFTELSENKIVLNSPVLEPCVYTVFAYALDESGNKSRLAKYSAVIDPFNYYIDGNLSESEVTNADGTFEKPFVSFSQLLSAMTFTRTMNIHAKGNILIPSGESVISSNWVFDCEDGTRLVFAPDSKLTVRSSSLEIKNAQITYSFKQSASKKTNCLFQLERSVLDFKNCITSINFEKSGTIINADSSVVNIIDSDITSSAETYASILASVRSSINVKKSRLSTIGAISVIFSAQEGTFVLDSSVFKVTGTLGRVAELFNVQSRIFKNSFTADLKNSRSENLPIYSDKKTVLLEYSDNSSIGF